MTTPAIESAIHEQRNGRRGADKQLLPKIEADEAIADAAAAWLRNRVSERPARGTNTIIVTHLPNIARAFPDWQPQVADGESVVLRLSGNGQAQVVGRIRIEDWSALAVRR